MTTALAKLSEITGASSEEVNQVIKGMIISSKNQHGATATNAEMAVITGTCARYGLNPLTKEAHAFISNGKLQLVIGIDGWIKIMNRQPNFNGVEFIDNLEGKDLVSVTTKIYIKGRDHPTCVTEYMDECFQPKSDAWKKYKKRMLRNKSLGQGIRIAFGISEVIDNDEADRIESNKSASQQNQPTVSVDYDEIDASFAKCTDDETLKAVASGVRKSLEAGGAWDSAKGKIAAMRVSHRDRINSVVEEAVIIEDVEVKEISDLQRRAQKNVAEAEALVRQVKGESTVIEHEAQNDEDLPDISFGDDESDEFGDK